MQKYGTSKQYWSQLWFVLFGTLNSTFTKSCVCCMTIAMSTRYVRITFHHFHIQPTLIKKRMLTNPFTYSLTICKDTGQVVFLLLFHFHQHKWTDTHQANTTTNVCYTWNCWNCLFFSFTFISKPATNEVYVKWTHTCQVDWKRQPEW